MRVANWMKLCAGFVIAIAAGAARADTLLHLPFGTPDITGTPFTITYDNTSHAFSVFGMSSPFGSGSLNLSATISNAGVASTGTVDVSDGTNHFISNNLIAFGSGENQLYEFEFKETAGPGTLPVGTLFGLRITGTDVTFTSGPNNGDLVGNTPDFSQSFEQTAIGSGFDAAVVAPTPQVALGGILLLGGFAAVASNRWRKAAI